MLDKYEKLECVVSRLNDVLSKLGQEQNDYKTRKVVHHAITAILNEVQLPLEFKVVTNPECNTIRVEFDDGQFRNLPDYI